MTLRAVVQGIGHYLPERIVPNAEFEATLDTSDEWIRTRSGIERRHFAAKDQPTSDLAVRAARALGVSNMTIMFRHMLPNAMVATLTMLPFIVTGTIAALATLDFLGFGLPSSAPSLGELTLQAKRNLQAPWLGFTAFFTFAIMLSLLVFIFEGVRDAFDPRKTFQ